MTPPDGPGPGAEAGAAQAAERSSAADGGIRSRVAEQFPWSEGQLRRGRPLEWVWSRTIGAPPELIWPIIADTSRLNRSIGLPLMEYRESGGALHGRTKYWGVRAEWIELPWEWVANRHLFCVREYSLGFARVFRAAVFLEPVATGTTLHMYFSWIPRGPVWRIFLKRMFPRMEPVYLKALARLDRHLTDPAHPPFHRRGRGDATAKASGDAAESAAAALRDRLLASGMDGELAGRWAEYIADGDPMDLYRIQIRRLAAEWGISERPMLESALRAAESGVLQLRWDVLCPHCRGPRASSSKPAELPDSLRCEVCRIDFLTSGEGYIDVTFQPDPSVRKVEEVFYCAAEPARKEHIVVQRSLGPGDSLTVTLDLPPGEYVAAADARERGLLVLAGSGSEGAGRVSWAASKGQGRFEVRSRGELELVNDTQERVMFAIRRRGIPESATRLGDLLTLPAFGRMFGSESLPINASIDLGSQTVVMIGRVTGGNAAGDAADADRLRELAGSAAREHEGVVIRSAGETALCIFSDTANGVRAAVSILRQTGAGLAGPIRASVHCGSCQATRTNTGPNPGLDVTGRTVVVASRLLSGCGGGQVMLSIEAADDPAVKSWLAEAGIESRLLQIRMEGPGGVVRARCLTPGNGGG